MKCKIPQSHPLSFYLFPEALLLSPSSGSLSFAVSFPFFRAKEVRNVVNPPPPPFDFERLNRPLRADDFLDNPPSVTDCPSSVSDSGVTGLESATGDGFVACAGVRVLSAVTLPATMLSAEASVLLGSLEESVSSSVFGNKSSFAGCCGADFRLCRFSVRICFCHIA